MGDKIFKWCVADSIDADVFHSRHDTREDALKEGYGVYDKDPFVLIEADRSVVKPNFHADWLIETLLEQLEEGNQECWGDDGADGAWQDIPALERLLQEAVAKWLVDHPPKTFCVDEFRTTEFFNGATA
ncbi:hypothetical protein QWJ46_00500 [Rhizobium sp. CBN3]|uniref:hypothetical protein n=1 Tax=Rhizobium sp. CBN3 TaxID=3058045 RepID=UPI002671A080|nr:hypothetical protein [Rhizobium sp. CBN3]MDO3431153.1 hypothetical protein [Rhizobium sp. CBN3]